MRCASRFWSICVISLCLGWPAAHGQNVAETNLDTLKLVQLIFRHGDRVPEYPYPNDPFGESTWPEGWAQMTDEGKRQEYQVGQYLRSRYQNYLNETYKPNQIYTLSSDTDRTIISALLVMAGLYPANNESNWDNTINWQPVPIRTIFKEQDNLIRMKRECPKFDALFDDFIRNDPEMKKLNEENKELFERLSKESGVNITTINDIDAFYATMFIEDYKGLDIPEWGKALKTDENFQYLYNLSFKAKTYNNDLKRLRTGELTKFFMGNINERVQNDSSTTKMIALSGHDTTLVNVLNTFGVLDLQRTWYSSVFIMELHQNPSDGNFFVELYLRNDTSHEPYKLTIPDCDFQCPLNKLISYTKPIIPDNWDEECKLSQPTPSEQESSIFTYILLALGVVAIGLLLVGLVCMALQRKRRNAYQRHEYRSF